MERSRSHIVASDMFFFCIYINAIYILIFIMKSQNRAKLACLYKLWAPKLYFAQKIDSSGGFSIKLVPGGLDRGVQICHDRPAPSSKQLAKCSRILFWSKDRL